MSLKRRRANETVRAEDNVQDIIFKKFMVSRCSVSLLSELIG